MTLHLPDYGGGGIVNLMASIRAALGGPSLGYPPLSGCSLPDLDRARTVLLLVIDGLGAEWVARHGAGGRLAAHLQGRLTSVCPSTTAAAIPGFLTGVAPLQHGFTGWFTWFAELGAQLTVLPFQLRLGRLPLPPELLSPMDLSGAAPFAAGLPVASHLLMPAWLAGSRFNHSFAGDARISGYDGLEGLEQCIVTLAGGAGGRRYLHAYWPEFDAIAHEHGVHGERALAHFRELDRFFDSLLQALAGSDTAVVVTADHGFVDTTSASRLRLEDHPGLAATLTMPLCGEPRLAFCYVDPARREAFEEYVGEHLSHAAGLVPRERMLDEGWFGSGEAHPNLHRRIGDYALVMRDHYSFSGRVPGERALQQVGVHGGLSADEMWVPLIYART